MFFTVLLLVTLIIVFIYFNGKYHENYWKKRNVEYNMNNKYLGPFLEYVCTKSSMCDILRKIYDSYPDSPAIGVANLFSPCVVMMDLDNITHVLATDFNSFHHRGFEPNNGDILADNILFQNGTRWKIIRQHISPLFTTAKLKHMYCTLNQTAQDFVECLMKNPQYSNEDTFKAISRFCCAAMETSIFGISTKTLFDSSFLRIAIEATYRTKLSFALSSTIPTLTRFFGIKVFKKFENFFISAIKQIIRKREREKVKRHDFADICVSLQKKDRLKDIVTGLEIEPTDELLAAQAFFLLIAGVEPSAESIFSTLVELGRNPEVLKLVHDEIDKIFQDNSEISYSVLSKIEYLDQVIHEALRLHAPFSVVSRICTRDTVLPVGNIKIDKGTRILIPVYSIHRDATYYPDPEKFIPERFSKQSHQKVGSYKYMPFSKGNRSCLGEKFAYMQVKVCLLYLLRYFTVKKILKDKKIEYKKDIIQSRISNTNVELVLRNVNFVAE